MTTEANLGTLTESGGGFTTDEDGNVILDVVTTPTEVTTETTTESSTPTEITPTGDIVLEISDDDNVIVGKQEEKEEVKEAVTEIATTEEASPVEEKVEEVVTEENLFDLPVLTPEQEKDLESHWKVLATEMGFDNAENIKSKEDYLLANRQAVEKHKQIVEVDLTKYNDEQRFVIEQLEKGVAFEDIINPVRELDAFLLSPDEIKVKIALQQQGLTETQVEDTIERLRDEQKLEDEARIYSQRVEAYREQQLKEIASKSQERQNKLLAEQQAKVSEERNQLEEVIKSLDSYKGLKLPESTKQVIISDIKSGKFFEKLNNAKAQATAYLDLTFGDKVAKFQESKLSEEKRAIYNSEKQKQIDTLHNVPPKPQAGVRAPVVTSSLESKSNDLMSLFDLTPDF